MNNHDARTHEQLDVSCGFATQYPITADASPQNFSQPLPLLSSTSLHLPDPHRTKKNTFQVTRNHIVMTNIGWVTVNSILVPNLPRSGCASTSVWPR